MYESTDRHYSHIRLKKAAKELSQINLKGFSITAGWIMKQLACKPCISLANAPSMLFRTHIIAMEFTCLGGAYCKGFLQSFKMFPPC